MTQRIATTNWIAEGLAAAPPVDHVRESIEAANPPNVEEFLHDLAEQLADEALAHVHFTRHGEWQHAHADFMVGVLRGIGLLQ